jgi:hypothetical protein
MKDGHRRHHLDQQEDAQAEQGRSAFGGAHDTSSRRWRHGGEFATKGRAIATAFFQQARPHSPMILTSTRLRRPPSNSP